MEGETNETAVSPSTTAEIGVVEGKRLWIIRGAVFSIIVIAVVAIPTSIILTKKIVTTTLAATTTVTISMPETTISTTATIATTITSVTKPANLQVFKRTNEIVYAIWNTTAGGDSTPSPPGEDAGTYWHSEPPEALFDDNTTTEYTNHGICNFISDVSMECGLNTGFYLTLADKLFTLVYFRVATNVGLMDRDPLMITIEGSNDEESVLTLGKSWILIYNGGTGLLKDPERSSFGISQRISDFSLPFASYRVRVTSKRGEQNSVGYSEFNMIGIFVDQQ